MKVPNHSHGVCSGAIARKRQKCPHGIEESFKLKSKFLFSILAVVPAVLMPLAAAGQVAPERPVSERVAPSYKYQAFAGFAYTSLNQVNQSRYGLMGVKLALTRDFAKHFGITANGDYYRIATASGNPGTPSVISVVAGPEVHATLYGNVDGFAHVLLGGEHTGGEGMTPNISFAGGVGGGLLYNLSPRLAIRASGDRMADSFSLSNNTPGLAYSPHMHWNARAAFGVVYRF
jgi:hypothetical protein